MKITIGDIEKRLGIILFPEDKEDEFKNKCHQREMTLKRNILRSFDFLNMHIHKPGFKGELNHWQKHKIDRNIKNLSEYIEHLYLNLDREKIIQYCKEYDGILPMTIERNENIFTNN